MTDKEKAAPAASPAPPPAGEPEVAGAWRVVPLEGACELSYCDEAGNPSRRRVTAREFRADRIELPVDGEAVFRSPHAPRRVRSSENLLRRKGKEHRRAASNA